MCFDQTKIGFSISHVVWRDHFISICVEDDADDEADSASPVAVGVGVEYVPTTQQLQP